MNNRLSPLYKNIALWLLISLVMIFLFNYFNSAEQTRAKTSLSYTQFLELVKNGKVTKVLLQGEEITGEQVDGKPFKTYAPNDPALIRLLQDKKVEISVKPKEDTPGTPPSWSPGSPCSSWWASGSSSCARCRPAAAKPCPSARVGPA